MELEIEQILLVLRLWLVGIPEPYQMILPYGSLDECMAKGSVLAIEVMKKTGMLVREVACQYQPTVIT